MSRVVHFEIQADDTGRAMNFYKEVFGWEFPKYMDNYWGIVTAPKDSKEAGLPAMPAHAGQAGINGGLLKRPCPAPAPEQGANAFVCTIQVENFDEIADKVLKAGGKVAMPKFALAGMAWQGYFLDTEGNTFGIHQVDLEAK